MQRFTVFMRRGMKTLIDGCAEVSYDYPGGKPRAASTQCYARGVSQPLEYDN
jgi:hypothetical protein